MSKRTNDELEDVDEIDAINGGPELMDQSADIDTQDSVIASDAAAAEHRMAEDIAIDESVEATRYSSMVNPAELAVITSSTKRSRAEIRKPLTSWMIFANENRDRLSKENPSLPFTEIAKLLGEQYRVLPENERSRLHQLAADEKVRYTNELRAFEASNGKSEDANKRLPMELVISSGRMKRIIKLDPEVKSIGKDATAALARTTELFIAHLVKVSVAAATSRGNRVIRDVDFVQAVHQHDSLEFLRLDFPKKIVMDALKISAHQMKAKPNTSGKAISSSSVVRPITTFFTSSSIKEPKKVSEALIVPEVINAEIQSADHQPEATENLPSINRLLVDEIEGDA